MHRYLNSNEQVNNHPDTNIPHILIHSLTRQSPIVMCCLYTNRRSAHTSLTNTHAM
jgi:hypothetical protein